MRNSIFIVLVALSGMVISESNIDSLPEDLKKVKEEPLNAGPYLPVLIAPNDLVAPEQEIVGYTLIDKPEGPALVIVLA